MPRSRPPLSPARAWLRVRLSGRLGLGCSRLASGDPIAALAIVFLRFELEAELLAHDTGKEPAHRMLLVTDTEPERLAPLPRQRQWASAGFAWWRRAVAPTRWRGVSKCPRANVRGPSRRARHPRCGRSRQRRPARSWAI